MTSQTLRIAREAVDSGFIEKLSPARMKNEFVHILEDLHPREAILALDQLGVMKRIHRRFSIKSATKFLEKLEACTRPKGVRHWFTMILALLYPLKLAYALEVASRLGFTRKETESLLKLHTVKTEMNEFPSSPSGVYRLASELPKEVLFFLMETTEDATKRAELQKYLAEYRFVKLEVDGHDLETLGVRQGPIYREVLDRTLDAKLDHGLQNKSDELAFIKKYLRRQR
jgi:tRNA nucleotidyltransferase (CCA-adding enzyme)